MESEAMVDRKLLRKRGCTSALIFFGLFAVGCGGAMPEPTPISEADKAALDTALALCEAEPRGIPGDPIKGLHYCDGLQGREAQQQCSFLCTNGVVTQPVLSRSVLLCMDGHPCSESLAGVDRVAWASCQQQCSERNADAFSMLLAKCREDFKPSLCKELSNGNPRKAECDEQCIGVAVDSLSAGCVENTRANLLSAVLQFEEVRLARFEANQLGGKLLNGLQLADLREAILPKKVAAFLRGCSRIIQPAARRRISNQISASLTHASELSFVPS
jgi:hypothetical protein